jgi:hypothetical protein
MEKDTSSITVVCWIIFFGDPLYQKQVKALVPWVLH